MRILIAEDDVTSRTMLTGVLERFGHDVVVTGNGTDAWDVLSGDDAPRLGVLDWMMPGLDGVEVIRRARSIGSEDPPYFILLTLKDRKADIVAGLSSGADDYISKPFDVNELRVRIDVGIRMLDIQKDLNEKIGELRRAAEHIELLQGIIPICSYCKKVRSDDGYWDQVEDYISKHSKTRFSHSICPDCMQKLYPDFSSKKKKN